MSLSKTRALAAAAIILATSGPSLAGTVKYYSRQKLGVINSPSYTYAPTYGAYGACSGGSQSASVSSCKRSDGTTVDNGLCSPQSITQACASLTCDTLVYYKAIPGPYAYVSGNTITTVAAAQTACAAAANQYGAGACDYQFNERIAYQVGTAAIATSYNTTYAAACH